MEWKEHVREKIIDLHDLCDEMKQNIDKYVVDVKQLKNLLLLLQKKIQLSTKQLRHEEIHFIIKEIQKIRVNQAPSITKHLSLPLLNAITVLLTFTFWKINSREISFAIILNSGYIWNLVKEKQKIIDGKCRSLEALIKAYEFF